MIFATTFSYLDIRQMKLYILVKVSANASLVEIVKDFTKGLPSNYWGQLRFDSALWRLAGAGRKQQRAYNPTYNTAS